MNGHPDHSRGVVVAFSDQERISHVVRRLGFGTQPDLVNSSDSVDGAIAAVLDLSAPTAEPIGLKPPDDIEQARSPEQIEAPFRFWFTQMISGPRRVEERLVRFWHGHFASDLRKVRFPYLMYQQHLTLRKHATGSFADLLHDVAIDPRRRSVRGITQPQRSR